MFSCYLSRCLEGIWCSYAVMLTLSTCTLREIKLTGKVEIQSSGLLLQQTCSINSTISLQFPQTHQDGTDNWPLSITGCCSSSITENINPGCLSIAEKRTFFTFSSATSSIRLYKKIYLTKIKNEK